jgi:DNA invertase Pin-like site-specific DNA recombinase
VDELTAAGINIYFQAQGLNTIVDGKPDATVKAMVSMSGAFAELERSTIVDRLQSGRRVALEKGAFTPGRPEGSGMTKEELLAKYPKAVRRLQNGRTIREVAVECGLSTKTVQKVKKVLQSIHS